MRNAACLGLLKVLFQPFQHFGVLSFFQFAFDLTESEVDDVVMVDFFRFQPCTAFKPNLVQQINFFGSQVRGMGAEVVNLCQPSWRINSTVNCGLGLESFSQARPALRASSAGDIFVEEPRTMVDDWRFCAARRIPSQTSVAATTASFTDFPYFSERASARVNNSCSKTVNNCSGASPCSPEPARKSTRM